MTTSTLEELLEEAKKKRRATQKRYNDAHKEEIKQQRALYNETHKEEHRRYSQAHPEAYRSYRLNRDFGITITDYDVMFETQNGRCAICGRHQDGFKRRFSVDHDHITGKIRELLCIDCNTVLGHIHDDSDFLEKVITYLKRHTS